MVIKRLILHVIDQVLPFPNPKKLELLNLKDLAEWVSIVPQPLKL